ncbi:MAG: L,D-transpeptidase family protein [Cardiobacteriaceae bacterium]|nr:L,D-transpeptidase family protein [Cardiobacteriaceae bacterium]
MQAKKTLFSILVFSLAAIAKSFAATDLLPDAAIPSSGQKVIINIPQARLFLFENGNLITSYPVGAGKPRTPTPLGSNFSIVSKAYKPTWTIPASIRRERRDGRTQIPYGAPGHPLGPVFVRFGPSLGIHGTSNPNSVPGWPSHGCVRMQNQNALKFAARVEVGTPVSVIHQRYSLNEDSAGNLWLGVYPNKYNRADIKADLIAAVEQWNAQSSNPVDIQTLTAALKKQNRLVCLNCSEKSPSGALRSLAWTSGSAGSENEFTTVDGYGDDLTASEGLTDATVGESIEVSEDDSLTAAQDAAVSANTATDNAYVNQVANSTAEGTNTFDNDWSNAWKNSDGSFKSFDEIFHDGGDQGQVIPAQ